MTLRVLIVDDEALARARLRTLLAERRTLMRYAASDADVDKIARRKADTIRSTITTLRDLRSELAQYED